MIYDESSFRPAIAGVSRGCAPLAAGIITRTGRQNRRAGNDGKDASTPPRPTPFGCGLRRNQTPSPRAHCAPCPGLRPTDRRALRPAFHRGMGRASGRPPGRSRPWDLHRVRTGGAAHRRKAGCPNPVPAIRPARGARGEPVRRHSALVRGPALCRSSRARARHGGGGGRAQPGSVAAPGQPTAAPTRRRPVLTFPGARLARPTASPAVTGAPCQIPGRSPAGHQRPETPRRPPVPWGGGAICFCGAGGAPGKPGAPLWNQTTNKQI